MSENDSSYFIDSSPLEITNSKSKITIVRRMINGWEQLMELENNTLLLQNKLDQFLT